MSNKHLRFLAAILAILALGSILLAACSRPGVTSGNTENTGGSTPSSSGGGGEPTVHMNDNNFVQNTVTVPKGQKLKLIDDSAAPHVLQNGMWDNGVAKNLTEPGAPTVNNLQIAGNATAEIGPFNTAGTFHIYCTIHPGMNLTVTVK